MFRPVYGPIWTAFDLNQSMQSLPAAWLAQPHPLKGNEFMSYAHLKLHADLVDSMASARGIDLEEVALRGDLTPSDISDLVLRCSGCTQTSTCQKWLSEQAGTVSAAPHYCRNGHSFDDLARHSG